MEGLGSQEVERARPEPTKPKYLVVSFGVQANLHPEQLAGQAAPGPISVWPLNIW